MTIPELTHGCNSWVAVSKTTGKAVIETWSRSVAEKINQEAYEVKTSAQYLKDLNKGAE